MASARSSGSDTTHHSARPRRMGARAIQAAAMATTTNIGTSHHARRAELAYRLGVSDEFIARGRVLINLDHWYHFRRAMGLDLSAHGEDLRRAILAGTHWPARRGATAPI